ncbi:MAG: porin [Hydrocarboniphaga sp.]|uniref:bZIP transcription factor n=1 Tax=Hydrocarboniphaga sp. TaxID=2033016 RepID=UPI0026261C94|nr:bZIP transcription factor [Hydrocarboniphaga sp.]MDB5967775.1 porin [Hydrocarboniphaga sp.]
MKQNNFPKTPRFSLTAISLAAALFAAPAHAAPDADALAQKLDALAAQVQAMQKEIAELKAQNEALAAQQEAGAKPTTAGTSTAASAASGHAGAATAAASDEKQLSIYGYGEIAYNHYDHDSSRTQADLSRAVFGFGYRFNDSTHFLSEFEFEHAVTSSDDSGEAEVEQFYVDHSFNHYISAKAGLFLIPSGLINTSHEPTYYYGVLRNQVETAIIPSTWREGGVGLHGSSDLGLSWDLGLTTGMKLANWDFTGTDGRESPFGAIHQELQFASASDLSQYLSADYNGVAGLRLGASVFTGEVDQSQPGVPGNPRATLWEGHARYLRGPLDLAALYAHGSISDTAALNLANAGQPTPIPEDFYGWYLQAAYKVWQHGTYSASPFVRFERYNTGASFASQPAGLGTSPYALESVQTIGMNFYLDPNVVLKIDYQNFDVLDDDRLDLGIGLTF